MNAPHRTWIQLAIGFILVAASAGALVAHSLSQRGYAEELRIRAERQGVELRVGSVTRAAFSSSLGDVRIRFPNHAGVTATVPRVNVRRSLFGASKVHVSNLHFSFTGEPTEVLAGLAALPSLEWLSIDSSAITAEYRHKVLGRLMLQGISTEKRGETSVVRAATVSLGGNRWHHVVLVGRRRNQMIEVGLGDLEVEKALVQFGYFPSSGGASQWTVTIKHQPARALGQRFGWDPGGRFDPTFVVGSASLLVPDDPALDVRGSVQVALDNWPKPSWADAEPLLGSTASFVARIEPSHDMAGWDLPDAEVSLSVFSMTGVGRIRFASRVQFAIDVQGERRCAQLEAHLPPSSYSNLVKEYLARPAQPSPPSTNAASSSAQGGNTAHDTSSSGELARDSRLRAGANAASGTTPGTSVQTNRRSEDVRLRLQWVADQSDPSRNQVAWHLGAGCGVRELSEGNFANLELPAFVRKKRSAHPH